MKSNVPHGMFDLSLVLVETGKAKMNSKSDGECKRRHSLVAVLALSRTPRRMAAMLVTRSSATRSDTIRHGGEIGQQRKKFLRLELVLLIRCLREETELDWVQNPLSFTFVCSDLSFDQTRANIGEWRFSCCMESAPSIKTE